MAHRAEHETVYATLLQDLRKAVHSGALRPGMQLPSEATLVRTYNISRASVRVGLSVLAQEGLIYAMPGRGSFVRTAGAAQTQPRVSLIVPDPGDPLSALIVAGATAAAMDRGWEVILARSSEDPALETMAISRAIARGDDGVIVFPADKRGTPDGLSLLREASVPTVLVDRTVGGFDGDVVTSDHAHGAYLATKHLIGLGHRRLAFMTTDNLTISSVAERLVGFRQALNDAHITFSAQHLWVAFSPMSMEERHAIIAALRAPQRPTAVFAVNDVIASALIALVEGIGLSVPQDLSVVGFDGLEQTARAAGLTTIRQPAEAIGQTAIEIIAARLSGRLRGAGSCRRLRVDLVAGITTAAPAPQDPGPLDQVEPRGGGESTLVADPSNLE